MAKRSLRRSVTMFTISLLLIALCGMSCPGARIPPPATEASASTCTPCSIPSAPATTDIVLDVTRISQSIPFATDEDSNLCWAAGIAMVSTYLGKPVEICALSEMRLFYKAFAHCCADAKTMSTPSIVMCNQGATSNEIALVLRKLGIYFTRVSHPITEELLERELAHGRPIYMDRENGLIDSQFGFHFRGRHVVVIIGRVGNTYLVINPSPFEPDIQYETYSQLLYGMDGLKPWRETWYELSFRADRCNPLFVPNCCCETP